MNNIIRQYENFRMLEDNERVAQFVISTDSKDRHGTVLNMKNWQLDKFNNNPVIGYQHNVYGNIFGDENPDNLLGTGRAWVDKFEGRTVLLGEVKFEDKETNPLADKIYRKIKAGTLRAASVGFTPIGDGKYGEGDERRGGKNETYYFDGQELLEFSIVNIPSNPDALIQDVRAWNEAQLKKDNISREKFEELERRYIDLYNKMRLLELKLKLK